VSVIAIVVAVVIVVTPVMIILVTAVICVVVAPVMIIPVVTVICIAVAIFAYPEWRLGGNGKRPTYHDRCGQGIVARVNHDHAIVRSAGWTVKVCGQELPAIWRKGQLSQGHAVSDYGGIYGVVHCIDHCYRAAE